ncbi:MAG: SIS domain-containing protein [Rhodobacterales bacterium]|nr:SIS domain-containing protein [Rhodobacterales bacterium]
MSFPDRMPPDAGAYADAYFAELARAQASIDRSAIAAAADLLGTLYARGGTLFVCGNGGSALIADSFNSDHAKLISTGTDITPRVVALAGSLSLLTAIGNDFGYDQVFVYPLKSLARPGDGLLTISSSGDSENIVQALAWARETGLDTVSFTGFGGGRSRTMADVNLHVAADNYGIVEDVHQSLMHLLAHHIRAARMPEDRIAATAF